jgi:ribosomal protein S27AE
MICPSCDGEGYMRWNVVGEPDALALIPCLECFGSGIVSCCDTAGSITFPVSNEGEKINTPSFTCQRCGAKSYNPNDIRERYCGRCHRWAD